MTRFYTKEQWVTYLVFNVATTAYLAENFLRRGRTVWAAVVIVLNLAALIVNCYIWHGVKIGRFSDEKVKQGRTTLLVIFWFRLPAFLSSPAWRAFRRKTPPFPPPSGRLSPKAVSQNASASSARAM